MEGNKQLAATLYGEVFNRRQVGLVRELARDDYIEHDPLPGQGTGLDGLEDRVEMLITAFEPHFTVEDTIAEGDKLVVRWTNSGTHVGEFMGIPPTGRSFTIAGIDIYRIEGGKLAEHWHVVDLYSQMVQLGLLPAPQGA